MTMPAHGTPWLLIFSVNDGACLLTPEAAQDATGRVEAGVETRHRGDDEDALDDRSHPVGAHPLEDGHERADAGLELARREDRHEQQDRAAVEDGDPEDDGIDGLGHLGLGVLHLPGGDTDHLDRGVGEDDTRHDEDRPVPVEVTARRPEAARVAPEVVEAGLVAADVEAADDEDEADDEEDDDGADLGDGGPELELTEGASRQEVDEEHHGQGDEHGEPRRHVGEPDRVQLVDATPVCWSNSSCSLNASAGVFQPRVLRGLLLRV